MKWAVSAETQQSFSLLKKKNKIKKEWKFKFPDVQV